MKVHEYQARQIFADHGIPVPEGETTDSIIDAADIAARFNKPVMVKRRCLLADAARPAV